MRQYDGPLLTCRALDDDDSLAAAVNPNSRTIIAAWGDASIRDLRAGTAIELERKGVFMVDRAWTAGNGGEGERPALLVHVPSGRVVRRY